MKVTRHADAAAFLDRARCWLLRTECENNLALGLAEMRAGAAAAAPDECWLTVEHGGDVVGCAFRTPPHRQQVTSMPAEAIPPLVDAVGDIYARLPGVGGPAEDAERFAHEWTRRRGLEWRVHMRLRLHLLTEVSWPDAPPAGELRAATDEEFPLVREWSQRFIDEVGISDDPSRHARYLLGSGRLHFWDDRGPRSMVAAARSTPNGVCINAVYTPPEERRRGYATAAVAALSRLLLARGYRFCCLYTDLANPTSNAIYRRIGYERVRDAVDIDFVPPA